MIDSNKLVSSDCCSCQGIGHTFLCQSENSPTTKMKQDGKKTKILVCLSHSTITFNFGEGYSKGSQNKTISDTVPFETYWEVKKKKKRKSCGRPLNKPHCNSSRKFNMPWWQSTKCLNIFAAKNIQLAENKLTKNTFSLFFPIDPHGKQSSWKADGAAHMSSDCPDLLPLACALCH